MVGGSALLVVFCAAIRARRIAICIGMHKYSGVGIPLGHAFVRAGQWLAGLELYNFIHFNFPLIFMRDQCARNTAINHRTTSYQSSLAEHMLPRRAHLRTLRTKVLRSSDCAVESGKASLVLEGSVVPINIGKHRDLRRGNGRSCVFK